MKAIEIVEEKYECENGFIMVYNTKCNIVGVKCGLGIVFKIDVYGLWWCCFCGCLLFVWRFLLLFTVSTMNV